MIIIENVVCGAAAHTEHIIMHEGCGTCFFIIIILLFTELSEHLSDKLSKMLDSQSWQ